MSSHTDGRGERVAGEVARRCGRRRRAVAPVAPGGRAELDRAVDVGCRGGMTRCACRCDVTRWRCAVATTAARRRDRLVPARARRGPAGGVQRITVAVDVRARAIAKRRCALAIGSDRRERGTWSEVDLGRRAVAENVTGCIPRRGHRVALGAGDLPGKVRRVGTRRRSITVTRHARGRPFDVTRGARLLGAPAPEVLAVTARAQGEVVAAARKLGAVELFTHRVEDARWMHARRAVDARLSQLASLGASEQADERDPRLHGMPWNFDTSHSLPAP